jgi:hypothetical protein
MTTIPILGTGPMAISTTGNSGVFCSSFMGVPFGGLCCVRSALSAAWGAHPFPTHRHQVRLARSRDCTLPITFTARGQVCGGLVVGAVGGFSIFGAAHG